MRCCCCFIWILKTTRTQQKPKMVVVSMIDAFVRAVAPTQGTSTVASVKPFLVVLFCIPMLLTTNPTSALEIRVIIMLLLNIFVRLMYPSAYYPASASVGGWLASPITARLIAFTAEFGLYEIWALWVGRDFWGAATYIWVMVLFGEVISTAALMFQSEFLFLVEDTTWAVHTMYMCLLSYPQYRLGVFLFGAFGAHMFLSHLPRRFQLYWSRGRREKTSNLIVSSPMIRRCEFEEKAWVVPMLLGQPLITALMFYHINN